MEGGMVYGADSEQYKVPIAQYLSGLIEVGSKKGWGIQINCVLLVLFSTVHGFGQFDFMLVQPTETPAVWLGLEGLGAIPAAWCHAGGGWRIGCIQRVNPGINLSTPAPPLMTGT
jgi:hypothetical protein